MKTSPNPDQSSGYSFAANTPHKDQSNEPVRQPKSTQDAFIYALISLVILGSLATLMLKIIGVIIGGPDAVPGIVYLFSYWFILMFSVQFFFSGKPTTSEHRQYKSLTDPSNTDPTAMVIKGVLDLPGAKV